MGGPLPRVPRPRKLERLSDIPAMPQQHKGQRVSGRAIEAIDSSKLAKHI